MRRKNSPGCQCCKCNPLTTTITVTVTDFCTGLPVPGASVAFKLSGVTITTDATDASGEASVGVEQPGNYTAEVSKANYTTNTTATISVTCNSAKTATVVLRPTAGQVKFTLLGRCANPSLLGGVPIPGATVTASQLGVLLATGITDSLGEVTFDNIPIVNATNLSAFNPQYSSQTGTANPGAVGSPCTLRTGSATVDLDADYHCAAYRTTGVLVCLASNELQFSSGDYGDLVLTWNPTLKRWHGTGTVTAGCPFCGCSAADSALEVDYGVLSEFLDIGGWHSEVGWGCGVTLPVCDAPPNKCSNCSWNANNTIRVGTPISSGQPIVTGGGACNPFFANASYQSNAPVMAAITHTASVSVTDMNPP